jgi:CLIP-associating protein 1/2
MAEAKELLKGVEEDWEKRTAALRSISPILTKGSEMQCVDALIEGLHKELSTQVADLRSQVVRVACKILQDIATEHGRSIAPLAAGVLPTLLKNLYVSVKAISMASAVTVETIVGAAPTAAILAVLLAHASDSHVKTRLGVAEYVGCFLRAGGVPSSSQVGHILTALKKLVTDADPKVREAAGKCFWQVHAQWAGPAEAMRAKLEPAPQKLLSRCKPK